MIFIWWFPKSWGYPQSSSVIKKIGFSITHPAIGLPPLWSSPPSNESKALPAKISCRSDAQSPGPAWSAWITSMGLLQLDGLWTILPRYGWLGTTIHYFRTPPYYRHRRSQKIRAVLGETLCRSIGPNACPEANASAALLANDEKPAMGGGRPKTALEHWERQNHGLAEALQVKLIQNHLRGHRTFYWYLAV